MNAKLMESHRSRAARVALPWREYMTSEEAASLASIEAEVAEIEKRRGELSYQRCRIVNRCGKRAIANARGE